MANAVAKFPARRRVGFSLVELTSLIVVLGVLTTLAVPAYLHHSERDKAANAFDYFAAVDQAQRSYHASHGSYAADLKLLDLPQNPPSYFSVGAIAPVGNASLRESWSLTLTRYSALPAVGDYRVTFTDQGFDSANSNIAAEILPQRDPLSRKLLQ